MLPPMLIVDVISHSPMRTFRFGACARATAAAPADNTNAATSRVLMFIHASRGTILNGCLNAGPVRFRARCAAELGCAGGSGRRLRFPGWDGRAASRTRGRPTLLENSLP